MNSFAVPVIAIFTKCEALEVTAMCTLQREGYTYMQAMEKAPVHAQEILNTIHLQLKEKKYPPQGYVYFQGE